MKGKHIKIKQYILYRGEEPLTIGTAQELADYLEVSVNCIYSIASRSHNEERIRGYNVYLIKG